jgi:DNA-binding XRE family transcriptional regulator
MSSTKEPPKSIEIFFSYSHKDQRLRDQLETQLSPLKREGPISSWHDRKIGAGNEWAGQIDTHLKTADIILLLVSPDFIASDYCYDIEMKRTMLRHDAGEARVLPIILRPCDWHKAPFGKLQVLPTDGKPITGRSWRNLDEAFFDVVQGIRKVVEEIISKEDQAALVKPVEEVVVAPNIIKYKRPDIPHFKAKQEIIGMVIPMTDEVREIVPSDTKACLRYQLYTSREVLIVTASDEAEEWKAGEFHTCLFLKEENLRNCTILHCQAQPGDRSISVIHNWRLMSERQKQRITLEGLADELGISSDALQNLEEGTIQPSRYIIRRLSKLLGKSAKELGFDDDDSNERWKGNDYDLGRTGYGGGDCAGDCG